MSARHDPQLLADINRLNESISTSLSKRIIGKTMLLMMEPDEISATVDQEMADIYRWLLDGGATENDAQIGTDRIRFLTIRKCAAMARAMHFEGGVA